MITGLEILGVHNNGTFIAVNGRINGKYIFHRSLDIRVHEESGEPFVVDKEIDEESGHARMSFCAHYPAFLDDESQRQLFDELFFTLVENQLPTLYAKWTTGKPA